MRVRLKRALSIVTRNEGFWLYAGPDLLSKRGRNGQTWVVQLRWCRRPDAEEGMDHYRGGFTLRWWWRPEVYRRETSDWAQSWGKVPAVAWTGREWEIVRVRWPRPRFAAWWHK